MKLNELDLKSIGAGIKKAFAGDPTTAGMTGQQVELRNMFIQDFMGDAYASLNSAIQGKLVDPKIKTGQAAGQAQPGQAQKPAGQAQQPAAAASAAKPAATASTAKKPTPAEIEADRERLIPDRGGANESKSYKKLNQIFEAIVLAEQESISDYLKNRWFPAYMKGVNYSSSEAVIDKALKEIETTWEKDQGKAAMNKLAHLAFSLSKGNAAGFEKPQQAQQPAAAASAAAVDLEKELMNLKQTDPNAFNTLLVKVTQKQ